MEKPRGSAPINVVNHALDYCDKNEDIDYAFCVFDQDEHSTFQSAMDKVNRYSKPFHRFLVLKFGLLFILLITLKAILGAVLNLLVIMLMTIY